MWLPTPVYERIPEFRVLLGLLFSALGLYIGFEYTLTFLCLAIGAGCLVRGARINMMRRFYRSQKNTGGEASAGHAAVTNS